MKIAFLILPLLALAAQAAPRASANYNVAAEAVDSAGRRATSASYTHDGSVGLAAGVSTVAAPAESAKHGYLAQLYDVAGLAVNSAAPSVNETGTLQLAAWQLLDDTSLLAVPAASVAWSVVNGPITGISEAGLATAGAVFQDTPARVQGILGGFTGPLDLTVLETVADNFGDYAADGLSDTWQVQYFGQPPNALAGPLADPDGDGQNNSFEFTADLNPTDPGSVFRLRIEAVVGQPGQMNVIFSPRFATRLYTVKAAPSLTPGSFLPLGSSTFSDDGQVRTVTDLSATETEKFYKVEITKP